MFFRGLFKFFLKFVSFKKVTHYLDLFYFNWLIGMNQNIKNTEFLNKFTLLFFSNINSKNYTIFNNNTLSVIYFRKKNLPMLEEWFKKTVYNYYNISQDAETIVGFFFFIEEHQSFKHLRELFKEKNDILNTYVLLRTFSTMNHFFDKQFYNTNEEENLIKFYFICYKFFYIFSQTTTYSFKFYDLRNYTSWFKFQKFIFESNSNTSKVLFLEKNNNTNSTNWFNPDDSKSNFNFHNDTIKLYNWQPAINTYSLVCKKFFTKYTYKLIDTIFNVRIDLNNLWHVSFKNNFLSFFKNYFPTRHSDSSINKFINLSKIDNFVVYHLRKIKIFNKGRYSRNRQTYRTGFYWCLWLNIFVVYGLQFIFYRYTFTYGYLWIFLFIFIGTFVFSRALKYNLISWDYIWTEKKEFFKFFKFIFINFYVVLKKIIEIFFNYFLSLLRGSEHKKIIWNESDFDVDTYNFFEKQWLYDIRNIYNDYVNDYFNDDVVNTVLSEIDLFDSNCEKNNLESEAEEKQIWLTVIHEYTAEIYQTLLIEFEEFKKKFFEKFSKL